MKASCIKPYKNEYKSGLLFLYCSQERLRLQSLLHKAEVCCEELRRAKPSFCGWLTVTILPSWWLSRARHLPLTGTARSWETQGKIRGNTGKIGGKSEKTQEILGENQRKHKKTWGKIRENMGKFRENSEKTQENSGENQRNHGKIQGKIRGNSGETQFRRAGAEIAHGEMNLLEIRGHQGVTSSAPPWGNSGNSAFLPESWVLDNFGL